MTAAVKTLQNIDHDVEILRVQSRTASRSARRNRDPPRQYRPKFDALPASDSKLQVPWKRGSFSDVRRRPETVKASGKMRLKEDSLK